MTEPALLEPPASPASPPDLADLVLLRLLSAKKSVSLKDLRKDLGVCFRRPPTADETANTVASLRAEGYITARGQRATDAGRARALQLLGVEKLPPRANWVTVKAKFLVPRALGLPLDSAEYAKANAKGEALAAFLLKRELDLPAETRLTMAAVVDAVLCRALGHPGFANLNALIRTKLGEAIGGGPINKGDAKKTLPQVRLNVSHLRAGDLHAAVLSGSVGGARIEQTAPEPVEVEESFDLEMFANTVKAAARTCPTGRFGGYKVFISHVWNQLRDEPRFAPLGFDGFKAKLVEANRAGLLTLSRADLVQLMEPADVRESETTYLTATFHFVLVEGN